MLVPNKPVKWWINWWLWIYENNVCELRCEPLPSRLHIHIFIRSSHKWFSNIHSQYLSHWSQTMVSYTEIKVTITFQSILNGITRKYCSVAFTCIVTGYSTDQAKRATYAHPKLKFSRLINTCFGQPAGKQRSNDYACVNIGWRTDPCCLTGIIRNHASQRIKLFWSYSSFNFLYFCFFSLIYRNVSFFPTSCITAVVSYIFIEILEREIGARPAKIHITYACPSFHCCDAVIKGESPYTFLSYFKRKGQNYLSCFWGRVRSCARAFRLCWIKARLFLISFGDTSLTNESIPKLKFE